MREWSERACVFDPSSPVRAVKYELLGCYETSSLWLNLQWGPPLPPPLPPPPPIRSSHNAAWKMRWAWQLCKHPPRVWPPLTAPSLQLSFERGRKCVRRAWLCVQVLSVIDPPSKGCTPILTLSVIVIALSFSLSQPLSLLTTLSDLITLSAGMFRHTGDCSVI